MRPLPRQMSGPLKSTALAEAASCGDLSGGLSAVMSLETGGGRSGDFGGSGTCRKPSISGSAGTVEVCGVRVSVRTGFDSNAWAGGTAFQRSENPGCGGGERLVATVNNIANAAAAPIA